MPRVDVGILTVIQPEFDAARAALGLFAAPPGRAREASYLTGTIRSERCARPYSVALGCIGGAGNPSAAAAAAYLIAEYRPRAFLLMGIAAGVRGKVRIGQVVLSERVVAYEPAALVRGLDGVATERPRPEIARTDYRMDQDRVMYKPDPRRITDRFYAIGGQFPVAPPEQVDDFREHVVDTIVVADTTIASGEKLLRDPSKLRVIGASIHDKVGAGDMEAVGVVEACRQAKVPWLIARGISDFGDDFKDDRFHELASKAAAAVTVDFLTYGLDLGAGSRAGAGAARGPRHAAPTSASNRFIFGRPVADDRDFFGRARQKNAVLRAIELRQPVQLVGERLMGKSSMLRWVQRHMAPGLPVVSIDPTRGLSPATMVRVIADALGRADIASGLDERSSPKEAVSALEALLPVALLVDDADALALQSEGFTVDFLNTLRDLMQKQSLMWISASREDISLLFAARNLPSWFLNDCKKEWLGALEPDEARALAGEDRAGASMIRAAGGFAHGLQWLGDQIHARAGSFERAYDAFVDEHRHLFHAWWRRRTAEERELLRACAVREVERASLADEPRRRLANLADRGLVREAHGRFLVEGEAWRSFVKNAP